MQSHVMFLSIFVRSATALRACAIRCTALITFDLLSNLTNVPVVWRDREIIEVVAVLRELRLTVRTVSPPAESEPRIRNRNSPITKARCSETSNDLHNLLTSPRAMEVPHNQAVAGPLAAFTIDFKDVDPSLTPV